jgi:hypothetical protein
MFPPANGAIVALQFVRELLYIGCEKKVVILNPKTEQAQDATSPCGNALVLCLLHDGDRLFVGYSDCKVRAWKDGQVVGTFDRHTGPVKVLAKEQHALFSGSDDQSVVRFNTNTGSSTVLYQGYNGAVRALVVHKNSIYFSDGVNLRAQSVETGACLWTGSGHKGPIYALLRHNDLIISGSADNTIVVRNIVTSAPICVIAGHTALVKCLSLRGSTLYSGSSDKFVMCWDLRDVFQKARSPEALAPARRGGARPRIARRLAAWLRRRRRVARQRAARPCQFGAAGAERWPHRLLVERAQLADGALDRRQPVRPDARWRGGLVNGGGIGAGGDGQYGQMPGGGGFGNNAVPNNDQYNSVPGGPTGYSDVRPDGGYGQVPQAPGPGSFQVGDGNGGYGQVPRPPMAPNVVANNNGAYGAVPQTTGLGIEGANAQSTYASIPTGTVGETPGYGVIPSAPAAGGAGNAAPSVQFDAPGYAQIPTGPPQSRALASSANLPHNAPGYAQIPAGPNGNMQSAAAAAAMAAASAPYSTIDSRYRRDTAQQQPGGAQGSGSPQLTQQSAQPPSMPGYATQLDPRYKR